MEEGLTGDFEAVLQIAARQLDGLLATLHQNGGSSDAPLQLLHSVRLRVGDVRRRPPAVDSFGDWIVSLRSSRRDTDASAFYAELITAAPPGAAARLEEAIGELGELQVPPAVLRGTAQVQVSTPRVTVPVGAVPEVTVGAHIRALYRPDPGTEDLPAPIHGHVSVTFQVQVVANGARRQLLIRPSADDAKIAFTGASGSGLDLLKSSHISAALRDTLRKSLSLPPVDLPEEYPFSTFKGVGTGDAHAIALPLQLSSTPAPPGNIQTITQSLVGSSGFALAVRKGFVDGLIDLEAIRQRVRRRRIHIHFGGLFGIGSFTVTYKPRFSSGPALTFRPGAIEVSGRIEVETDNPVAPNGFMEFKQVVRLSLDPATQAVALERVGDPEIDESWFIPRGRVASIVKAEMDQALASAKQPVRKVFDDARETLRRGLRVLDLLAAVRYGSVEVTPGGIIVRGNIGTSPRPVPVVDVRETSDRTAFTAFHSWIPAGDLARFTWSWVEYPSPAIWSGQARSRVEENGFILQKPAGVTSRSEICLRVEGGLLSSGGVPISVAGGSTCLVPDPGYVLEVPAWFEPVTVPLWRPDIFDRAPLRDALAAHVTVQSITGVRDDAAQNTLVFFADWRSESPLAELGAALSRLPDRHFALTPIVVVPAGAFNARRKELEAKLAPLGERFLPSLHVTEDDEGGWTRTFAPARLPATFLVDSRRKLVWHQASPPDPETFAPAIDRLLMPATTRPFIPLRLSVVPGQLAPDTVFDDGCGRPFAFHRLRGRPVTIVFWQSWSAPCVAQLRELQSQVERKQRDGAAAIGVHGGPKEGLERIRRELGVDFPLVQDSEQRIASAYGIRCWPTTVTIDGDGRLEHVQFGVARGRAQDVGVAGCARDGT